MNPTPDSGSGTISTTRSANGGTMLRVFGAAQKREVKATKNLAIIVFFFIICWIPLYTINCVEVFCPDCFKSQTLTDCCIILSHLNSAVNPLLYAYHLRDFRAALKNLLCGMLGIKDEVTEYHGPRASFGSNVHHLHGVHTSRNNSVQSLRDVNQLKLSGYADFKIANSCLNTLPAELTPKMWTLQEVPSVCEDETSNSARRLSGSNAATPVRIRSVAGRSTSRRNDGKVNSGYIDDSQEFEEGDDDVFIESGDLETRPTSSEAALEELPFRHSSLTSVWDRRSSSLRRERDKAAKKRIGNSARGSLSSEELDDTTIDLINVKNSLLIVEAEINNQQVDVDDKTELSANRVKCHVVAGNGDLKILSAGNYNTNSSLVDTECKRSPLKQLRLSPLKYVGDLLFKSAASKSANDQARSAGELDADKTTINQRRNGSVRLKETNLDQSSDEMSAVT